MKLTFLGAVGTVTGSKYLLEDGNYKVLVDCGLFQGLKELRLRNWAIFPVNPADIDAIVLTHAHIDHSGYVPLLVKNGFKGKIYCSEMTSCGEAKFYQRNCPGTKMDGDGDGIPCESQWCGW